CWRSAPRRRGFRVLSPQLAIAVVKVRSKKELICGGCDPKCGTEPLAARIRRRPELEAKPLLRGAALRADAWWGSSVRASDPRSLLRLATTVVPADLLGWSFVRGTRFPGLAGGGSAVCSACMRTLLGSRASRHRLPMRGSRWAPA